VRGLGGRARGARREGGGGFGRRERAEVAHGTGVEGVCCAACRCEKQQLHRGRITIGERGNWQGGRLRRGVGCVK